MENSYKNIPKVVGIKNGDRFTILCPYCKKQHEHSLEYGHRLAHCNGAKNDGYIIVKGE